jgi:hypothetical protein
MTEERERRQPPEDVGALLERIEAAWRDLLATLDDIPEERLEEPGASGEWSIKNLMGHLATWDDIALAKIERVIAGQPEEDADFQAINDADHAARQGRTLAEERSAMHRAHAAVVERLESIAGIDATAIDAAISPDTYDHYTEHIPDIQQWRNRAGL